MNFTDKVIFISNHDEHYDPQSGTVVHDEPTKTERLAHVVTPSEKKSVEVYGNLKTSNVVVHLKQPFLMPFDHVLIGNRKYNLVTSKVVKRRQIITLEGLDNGN